MATYRKLTVPKWMHILINIDGTKNQWQIQNDSGVSTITCYTLIQFMYNKNLIEIDYQLNNYRGQKKEKPQKGRNRKYVLTPKGERVVKACRTIINELEGK